MAVTTSPGVMAASVAQSQWWWPRLAVEIYFYLRPPHGSESGEPGPAVIGQTDITPGSDWLRESQEPLGHNRSL